jgi:hypothetical protein
LSSYNQKSIIANNAALSAKAAVSAAEKEVARSNFDKKTYTNEDRKTTDNLASALAKGLIRKENGEFKATGEDSKKELEKMGLDPDNLDEFSSSVYTSSSELTEYGSKLNDLTSQQKSYYEAMAAATTTLIDLSNMT